MKKRSSVAIPALAMIVALAAAASPAEAGGKGKVQRSQGLGRNGRDVVFHEKMAHHQGIRRVLSGGLLGRTMKLENTINADGVQSTIGRGRIRPPETVTHTTTGIPNGTRTESGHNKRGLIMRWKNRRTISRTDEITQGANGSPDVAHSETSKHRFTWNPFSNKPGSVKEIETSRMEIDQATGQDEMGGTIEKLDRDGYLTAEPRTTGGRRWGKAFRSKLEGFREVVATPNGPEIHENYTMRYGFWRSVVKVASLGIFGDGMGKTVSIDRATDAFGTSVTMRTPKEIITRSTEIQDGRTVSNGTYARDGFWSNTHEKDSVVIDDQKGVHVVEKLRSSDGSTKKAITTTQFAEGARSVQTETAGKFKLRASSPRAGGGKNWMRLREGKVLSWQYGRVDGKFAARFDTPWFNLGSKVFTYDAASGEVGVAEADDVADEAYAAE